MPQVCVTDITATCVISCTTRFTAIVWMLTCLFHFPLCFVLIFFLNFEISSAHSDASGTFYCLLKT